ncbi:MAG: polyprenyl synthetase family protein [Treponema sp.]|jgi:octaprenyl-diphosphate synthase|nr:polyprenyl synthetase family protein [Treponema sp.]
MELDYTQLLKNIEAALDRWLPENVNPVWAEEVFPGFGEKVSAESLKALILPGRDMILRGGKRWRPLLMMLVCESLGGGDAVLPFIPLVEFCHNASLIHDDMEDASDERRGKPVIHQIYGIDTAINSGSFLYFLASCCIESCVTGNKDRFYRLWAECMCKLHLGQAIDIKWHRDISFIPEIEEYYAMGRLKTGSLTRFAVEIGAYAAGVSPEAAQQLGEAAEKLGLGFQILDDVKNLTGSIPGKKRGDDMVEGKKSLPVLLYAVKYPEKREHIAYCFYTAGRNGPSEPEVEELIQDMVDAGVLAEAEERGRFFIEDALKNFSATEICGFPMNENGRSLIADLIGLIS